MRLSRIIQLETLLANRNRIIKLLCVLVFLQWVLITLALLQLFFPKGPVQLINALKGIPSHVGHNQDDAGDPGPRP